MNQASMPEYLRCRVPAAEPGYKVGDAGDDIGVARRFLSEPRPTTGGGTGIEGLSGGRVAGRRVSRHLGHGDSAPAADPRHLGNW